MGGRQGDRGLTLRLVGLLVFLGLGLVAWYVSKQDTLLALLLALLQVLFAVPLTASGTDLDEPTARRICRDLHGWQKQAWKQVATSRHMQAFLTDDGRSAEALFPPRVGRWPDEPTGRLQPGSSPTGRLQPDSSPTGRLQPGLVDHEQVAATVDELLGSWPRLAVTGAEDVGKTVFQMLLLLQSQRMRDAGATAALPLLVPLAQWPVDRGVPVTMSLQAWVGRRLREDYPNLNLSAATTEAFVEWLWDADADGRPRRMLFLDGIDELTTTTGHRAQLLRRLLGSEERGAGPVVVACRASTWQAFVAGAGPAVGGPAVAGSAVGRPAVGRPAVGRPADWQVVELAVPADDDVRAFITSQPWRDHLIGAPADASGGAPHPIRSSLRLLQVVADIYCGEPPVCDPPDWLADPPAEPDEVRRRFWADVVGHVDWPAVEQFGDREDRRDFEATVAWLHRQHAFAGSGSAWWQVPRLAAADAALTPAVRTAGRRRWRSVLGWTAGAWLGGMLVVLWALAQGWVVGYPRSDQGLGDARGLTLDDLDAWRWDGLPVLVANPVYDALLAAAALLAVVSLLTLLGGELEHPDGGRPRPLRMTLPTLPRLRRVGMPRRTLTVLFAGTAIALATVAVEPRSAPAVVGIVTLPWAITFAMGWLLASVRSTEDSTGADAADLFGRDRRVTAVVALVVGSVGAVAAVVSHWAVTAGGGTPTVTALVWMMTAVALFVGVGRGICLGAAMGLTRVVPLRPGFGFGYAARLELLERAARSVATTSAGEPFRPRWLELFGLVPMPEEPAVRPPGHRGVRLEAVVPAVGARLQVRDASLGPFLEQLVGTRNRMPGAGRRWLRVARGAVITGCAAGLLTVATGIAPVVLPRLPCGGLLELPRVDGRPAAVASNVWWENGQCVGFVAPGLEGWPDGQLRSGAGGDLEQRFAAVLARIAAANQGSADLAGGDPLTVVFLAPLTRTDESYAINALWQLDGAAAALARINVGGAPVPVRLVVANAGENFVAGPAVVRALNRAFPAHDGRPGIDAVIGIAQSRESARVALDTLDPRVQVIGASVYGTWMKAGLANGVPPIESFTAVAPSDRLVAGPMVDQALATARAAGASGGASGGPPRLGIIYDPLDPYFSVDLLNALRNELDRRVDEADLRLLKYSEVAGEPARRRQRTRVVAEVCAPGQVDRVWLYAGRGNLWTELDAAIWASESPAAPLARCQPRAVGGPGIMSAVAGSGSAAGALRAARRLTMMSLAQPDPMRPTAGSTADTVAGAVPTAAEIAAHTDRELGAAALLLVDGLKPYGRCPGPPSALGLAIDPATGHNTLAAGDHPCSRPGGSTIRFCSFAEPAPGQARCTVPPSALPAPPRPAQVPVVRTLRAVVNQPPRNSAGGVPVLREPRRPGTALGTVLPWESAVTVVCQVPPTRADADGEQAWVGVRYAGTAATGSGFVRWRYRLRDRNVYLRFPELGGALAAGDWGSGGRSVRRLPANLPGCPDNTALIRLLDRP